VHFRVWAPRRKTVEVALEGRRQSDAVVPGEFVPLTAEPGGYFSGAVAEARAGTLYRYRLDGGERYPDPASRFQPEGPHGPSQVVDPGRYEWRDLAWKGVSLPGQVFYEMHVGTFTQEGSWESARRELAGLARLGVTVLELMPLADFPGHFGWGYDGVNLFAPSRLYGYPDDCRRFVDEAHASGLAVILDVVYNHLGPDANYLPQYTDSLFNSNHKTDWGEPINFYREGSQGVREYFLANARYWIQEFHLDGVRLDATQNIYDESEDHILAAVAREVRTAARGRGTIVVAENESQDVRLLKPPAEGGFGMDAAWNDDFHHAAVVALTARREAYYTDYRGAPQEFVSSAKYGFLFQGQRYTWQKQRRGTPTFGLKPPAFVNFLENHDQVANSPRGLRLHQLSNPARYRALTALLLLGPGTPLLFQGQEFGSQSPFLYFADHSRDLMVAVRKGRRAFLAQFRSLALPEWDRGFPDAGDRTTFTRCQLDHRQREVHQEAYSLHADLLALRREDPVFHAQGAHGLDGAVVGDTAFVLRYFAKDGGDRLLVVNLGVDLHLDPAPEPLLAPPPGRRWRTLWSSEDVRYGGTGTFPLDSQDNWRLPGEAAVALAPREGHDDPPGDPMVGAVS
jgi:maltooligosyltrehalose trehalohydrolase